MKNKKSIVKNACVLTAILFLAVPLSGCVYPDQASLQAYFNFSPSNPDFGERVSFTAYADESFGIDSWAWDFGDEEAQERSRMKAQQCAEVDTGSGCYFHPEDPCGGGSHVATVQNPIHVYCEPGNYMITLTVQNVTGGVITKQKEIVVGDSNNVWKVVNQPWENESSETKTEESSTSEYVEVNFTWEPEIPDIDQMITFRESVTSSHPIVHYNWRLESRVGNDTSSSESSGAEFSGSCYDPATLGRTDIKCIATLTVQTDSDMSYTLSRTLCLSGQDPDTSSCETP